MQYFQFKGRNRRIVVLPRSAGAPSGYSLASEGGNQAQALVDEISPHLAKDVNALAQACGLLKQVSIIVTQQARQVAPRLCEAIRRELVHVYTENPQSPLHYSTEEAGPKASASSSVKQPEVKPSNQGKQGANAAQSGSVSNNTPTEVPISEQACRSDPVSLLSGEEILPLDDFTYHGLVPITWRRLYRSSKINNNVGLGYGWRHGYSAQLLSCYQAPPKVGPVQAGKHWFELIDEEGAVHVFDQVKPGQTSYQTSSGLALFHQVDGKQVLIKPDDSHWTFIKQPILIKDKAGKKQKQQTHVWLLDNISNHLGQSITLHYDDQQRLVRLSNSPKRGIALQYNQQNNVTKIAAYRLDENNKKVLQSPLLAHYQYNDAQAMVSATNSEQNTEHYLYRQDLLLARRTRASGFSHHFLWQGEGAKGQCIEQWGDNDTYHYRFTFQNKAATNEKISTSTDSFGHTERFVHNAQGLLTEYTNNNGDTTVTDYDDLGRKVKVTDPQGGSTAFDYNEQGQLCSQTDALGNKTHYHYNNLGKRITTIDALGRQHKRHYDATGRLLAIITPDGRKHSYRYTEQGKLDSETDLQGIKTQYHWSVDGELLAKQVANNLTRFSYDKLGRINADINSQGLVTEYKRNRNGQVSEQCSYGQSTPHDKTVKAFSYDNAGRLLSIQASGELESSAAKENDDQQATKYLKNNQPGNQPDSQPELTLYQYQGLAQPSKKTFADGSWLSYGYDNERNLTEITRSDGAQYQLRYSPTEKPIELIGFDGRKQTYQYDVNDQLTSVNDSGLRFIRLTRDKVGRIIEQSASQAPTQDKANNQGKGQAKRQSTALHNQHNYFQYDKIGRLVRAHNSERTVNLTYHANGQLSTSEEGHWTLHYNYNNLGQRQSVQLPDGNQLCYQYTEQGQLSQVSLVSNRDNDTSSKAQMLVSFQYNNAGLNTQQRLGNGIELTQQFDVYSRLTNQQWQRTDESLAFSEIRTYQYDNKHQLTALQHKTRTQAKAETKQDKTFRYNSLSQLISTSVKQTNHTNSNNSNLNNAEVLRPVDKEQSNTKAEHSEHIEQKAQYQWDAFGNPQSALTDTSQSDIVVINDQLHRFAGTDYRFDSCGNQISLLGKGNKQQRVYNALNQLKQLNHNGKLAHYEYDALGRRSAKITEQGRIDFIWDNNQLIGEHQNGKFTWFVYQPDTFLPIALIKQDKIYYYHLDQLGTPLCLTDSNATQVWRNDSDAFGYELGSSNESNKENSQENTFTNLIENPLRFQGQYFDEESNLHYNRFRYYCPKQQRFINQDPIGLVGGVNHYQYAPNPVNWVDPFGLLCKEGQAKVAEAINNSDNISSDLAKQLIEISQLIDSPYTADEMVDHINSGTAEQLIAEDKLEPNSDPKSLEECQERLNAARENIIKNGYKAKYSDKELVAKAKGDSVGKSRFLISFQPVNGGGDAKLAYQKDNGLVALWATSFDMLENADSDPQIIADLLATGYDPKKDYVLHIVDRGEDLALFGENTFVPTWDKLEEPAINQLEPKYHDAIGDVLNSDYQKQYAAHMEDYWGNDLNEFNKKDQKRFLSSLDKEQQQKFSARHALRTEFGANSEFTGDGMTQCRHAGNNHGVVETLTLENDPPTIAEMHNVTTIHLNPIKG
ncbi:RHS repeat-associated core domain-containing protein [Colwellia sp. E2M01]|uniref:RHS repeat-associated core domain-containing protein n=1 Tax=Colwellia sp. E2M01 TaxID=2841561 RepID=UPI001C096ECE|nr:RHS domain-containing protein [Colwellia sp. E2M01]